MAKLFRTNEAITEVKEWCIAESKTQAFNFMNQFWDDGEIMEEHYVEPWLKENPGLNINDFIEVFFIEENPAAEFTHPYGGENDEPKTKTVQEWIDEAESIPSYLCHEKWD